MKGREPSKEGRTALAYEKEEKGLNNNGLKNEATEAHSYLPSPTKWWLAQFQGTKIRGMQTTFTKLVEHVLSVGELKRRIPKKRKKELQEENCEKGDYSRRQGVRIILVLREKLGWSKTVRKGKGGPRGKIGQQRTRRNQ